MGCVVLTHVTLVGAKGPVRVRITNCILGSGQVSSGTLQQRASNSNMPGFDKAIPKSCVLTFDKFVFATSQIRNAC
jgi:hypothetical protein